MRLMLVGLDARAGRSQQDTLAQMLTRSLDWQAKATVARALLHAAT